MHEIAAAQETMPVCRSCRHIQEAKHNVVTPLLV